ncbi:autotransporter domain-containing protein [Dyella tabacisoli]|uniref:Autotransporter domain-containing protein n=1 Tax=Dyella tabacisoli TaxID=2282381 RepID=A0A369UM10_9GAMM|nr:autotransporter domain-containing protein [Dyella tabacisoli]RDD80630.1 autotransporter domain-containing protein [Dyella tabacisoli]
MKLKVMAALTAAALGTLAGGGTAEAMNIHVNGNQVFLSGDVKYSDLYVLADVIDRLRSQGKSIDTLVMRNSNGGSVYAGYDIGDFARRNNLKTVVSGYCISACSMMFVGGATRAFANQDQPLWNQYIGIHGVTGGDGGYQDSSRSTPFYQYFLQAIANGNPANTDTQLQDDAFSDHGSAYARLFDPAAKQNPAVFWCHSNCNDPKQYKAYPNDNVYNLGYITEHTAAATTDTLTVSKNVSGNINPNYYNAYDPSVRPYLNETMTSFSEAWNFLTANLSPQSAPVLTNQAFLDDIEVQLYNRLSPADRKRLLTQYTAAYYLQTETLQQFQQNLTDPNSYESQSFAQINNYSALPFVDRNVLSVGDAYGIIKVTNGATWTLGSGLHSAADALILDGGNLHLDGGTLNVSDNYFSNGGVLEGAGTLGAATQWATVYVSDLARIHPTGNGLDVTGNIRLNANALLAIDVNPALAHGPAPLRFDLYNGGTYSSMSALSIRSKTDQLALNVSPGFYQPGQKYALVGYSADLPKQLASAAAAQISPSDINIVYGSFKHLLRADANGVPLAGYDVDPTAADPRLAAFHPFDGSLVSFQLIQQLNGIWLQANNPFADSSLCGPADCGLSHALSAAAQMPGNGLQPLLGALEFANSTQAARVAGQLRGESYGSLRTASLSLLGDFGGALNQHLRAANPSAEQAANVAFAAGAAGMGLDNPRRTGDLSSMMSYLVANDDTTGGGTSHSDGAALWGRLFGNRGHLDGSNGVAGMRQHSVGVMLGLDKQVGASTVIGGSLGYGKLRADGVDNGFNGRVRALDARFYVDYRYDRGYLDAVVGYTHLRNSTHRAIELPPYFAQANARYDGNAYSLHLEHGWTLRDRHDVVWQPIFPSIDLVRLPGTHFADQGAGAAGLNVDAKHVTDSRIGVGLQVYKTFDWSSHGELTPHARLLLQHRFSAHENGFLADLQGYPQGVFEVSSQREGLNHALLNLGLSARRGASTSFMLDYLGDFAKRHRDHGVMLGARYRW